MIRAYIIYEPSEAEKNREFIRMFQKEGERYGISFSYVSVNEYQQRELPDIVLNRTRLSEVSLYYERYGCMVLHDSVLVEMANNKWKTLVHLYQMSGKQSGSGYFKKKWMPDTLCLSEGDGSSPCIMWKDGREQMFSYCADDFMKRHPAAVIKTLSGHGGEQVQEIGSVREICLFRQNFPNDGIMVQEKIACRGRDIRMYVLGGELYQGMIRQGKDDFRSNYSRGGTACVLRPSGTELLQMNQVLQCFRDHILGMAGIDFLLAEDGRIYFNELEEMVGSRMLYQVTDKNIVGDYVQWIRKFL